MKVDRELWKQYMTLTNALKSLPGVKPNLTKRRIKEAGILPYRNGELHKPSYLIGATRLTRKQYDELWIEDPMMFLHVSSSIKVSPKGAKILLALYHKGDLVMKEDCVPEKETPLKEYVESETSLKEKVREIEREEARIKDLCEHTDKVKESDFSYEFFSRLFWYRFGGFRGTNSLILDGIKVTKDVTVYKSNSGKSSDARVVYSWVGSDGERHSFVKDSLYDENRRNDAGRNWGLPE